MSKKQDNCKDNFCEFLRHGVCVVKECVWKLSKDGESYEKDLKPEFKDK